MEGAKKIKCPVCGERFELESDLEAGDTTFCPGCSEELEIVSLHPLAVKEVDIFSDNEEYDEEFEE